MHRVHLTIHGFVQGVGFRGTVRSVARSLGVTGWVANRRDGAVVVEAEGALEPLGTFVARVRAGPPHARVERVDERWEEGPARHRGFEIRSTT
jgi:acylphosphatase